MRRAIHLLSILAVTVSPWLQSQAQTPAFGWARSLGRVVDITETAEDPEGRVIVLGKFTGTRDLDLGPGVMEVVDGIGNSTFLAAIQADGTMDWAVALTSTNGINGYDMAVAPDGSIVVTGAFRGSADLDPSPASQALVTASGNNWDLYIAKYSSDGLFQWGFDLGNSYDQISTRIALDGSGNIIHAQDVRGTFDMDPGSATVSFNGGSDGVGTLSKYAPDGTFLWYKAVGITCQALGVLANGEIVGVSGFAGEVIIGQAPNTITIGDVALTSAQAIVRFDAQGDPLQGVFIPKLQNLFVAVAPDGAVTMAGSVVGESDLDPGPGTNIHTSNGFMDAFALRVNADLEGEWGVTWGDQFSDELEGMDVDGYGNVYIVASLYGPYDVDPGPATYLLDNAGATNGYLLQLDAEDGALGFAARLMNSDAGYLSPRGISVTSNGTIVTHGAFRATAAMDPWTNSFDLTVAVVQTEELYVCTFGQDIGLLTQEVKEQYAIALPYTLRGSPDRGWLRAH